MFLVVIPKVNQAIKLISYQTMGKILVYNKTNILVHSSKIMHVIHTNQEITHISLGSKQGDQISLGTMFGVIGVLKKAIWNVNVRSKPWWIM